MKIDSIAYNTYPLGKDSITWFCGFIRLQDEAPLCLLTVKEDTILLKNRIVQTKVDETRSFSKSVLSSHLLRSKHSIPDERTLVNTEWASILIISCFMLFAISQYGYVKRMQKIIKAFFTNRFFIQFSREGGLYTERASMLLFISYILAFSLFIFNSYKFYFPISVFPSLNFLIYLKVLIGVIIFYLLKMALFWFNGYIFRASNETSDYVLNLYLFGQITGICLLPVIVITTYFENNKIVLYAGAVVIILLSIYRLLKGFVIALSKSKVSAYYIFLYLCTLEILPLVLLVKIFRITIT
jgi:hypothetical protein